MLYMGIRLKKKNILLILLMLYLGIRLKLLVLVELLMNEL